MLTSTVKNISLNFNVRYIIIVPDIFKLNFFIMIKIIFKNNIH